MAFVLHKLPLQERLERLLQVNQGGHEGNKKLVFITTESVVKEMAALMEKSKNEEKKAALQEAHDWIVQNCTKRIRDVPEIPLEEWASEQKKDEEAKNALTDLSPAGRDLLSVLMNCNGILESSSSSDNHERIGPAVLLATQDESLLHLGRQSGKVPVIRLARGSVLLLEQPSHVAQQAEQQAERNKWMVHGSLPEQEKILVDLVKQKERQESTKSAGAASGFPPHGPDRRRKRKAKGPNPLSCKRKKSEKTKKK